MPTLTKLYSMEEAAQHGSKNDCWTVIDGKVYDVTTYLDDHPGGDDVILEVTGKDATDEFEDAGHSKDARDLMETYLIGEIDQTAIPELKIVDKKTDNIQSLIGLTQQYWPVPVAVVGIAVIVGFLYLRKK